MRKLDQKQESVQSMIRRILNRKRLAPTVEDLKAITSGFSSMLGEAKEFEKAMRSGFPT